MILDAVADPSILAGELPRGALVLLCEGSALDAEVVRRLRGVRVRVPVPGLDEASHLRFFGRGTPRESLRGVAIAVRAGVDVELAIPVDASAPARMHGLARALPRVKRYVVIDDGEPEIESIRATARELGVDLVEEPNRIDTELQALLAGIKPAIRLSTRGEGDRKIIERYTELGLHAVVADGVFVGKEGIDSQRMRLVYVARTRETAEAVRDLEATTFRPVDVPRDRGDEYEALGLALGYPACCVKAFVSRVVVAPDGRMRRPWPAEYHVTAAAAWGPEPAWQLNHLLFETGDAVISFTPCSYRCPTALAYAAAVLERCTMHVDRLRRKLGVDVVVDARGARVVVEREGSVVVRASPRRTRRGELIDPMDEQLAERVIGARVEPGGRLAMSDEHPPVLVPFSVTARA